MLIYSILFLLLSNAVTLRRDKSILFSRVAIIVLIYSSLFAVYSLLIDNSFQGGQFKIIEYPWILLFIYTGATFLVYISEFIITGSYNFYFRYKEKIKVIALIYILIIIFSHILNLDPFFSNSIEFIKDIFIVLTKIPLWHALGLCLALSFIFFSHKNKLWKTYPRVYIYGNIICVLFIFYFIFNNLDIFSNIIDILNIYLGKMMRTGNNGGSQGNQGSGGGYGDSPGGKPPGGSGGPPNGGPPGGKRPREKSEEEKIKERIQKTKEANDRIFKEYEERVKKEKEKLKEKLKEEKKINDIEKERIRKEDARKMKEEEKKHWKSKRDKSANPSSSNSNTVNPSSDNSNTVNPSSNNSNTVNSSSNNSNTVNTNTTISTPVPVTGPVNTPANPMNIGSILNPAPSTPEDLYGAD
jgi:hypothetical protein